MPAAGFVPASQDLRRLSQAHSSWVPGYLRRVVLTDVAVIVGSTVLAYLAHVGEATLARSPGNSLLLLGLVCVTWLATLYAFRAYESRFMGLGSEEYDRVLRASILTLALVASVSWLLQLQVSRGYVVLAIPLGTVVLLALRYANRQLLHRQRARGLHMQSLLVAGHRPGVLAMVRQISRARYHGFEIAGVCLPPALDVTDDELALAALGVPVLGDLADLAEVSVRHRVDAVAVLPTPEVDGAFLRRLGWALEGGRSQLYVAPAVTEVVGPRVAIRPVCGLPLLQVERPELSGFRRLLKGVFDRVAATLALVVLAPLLLVVAVAVKVDSRGPVLFRQERVGLGGRRFGMLKFRSMVVDAEARLRDLADSSEGNAVLFKMRVDPRVTRVGRILRRTSLDELPQLVNVVLGDMSLVGPRPPLAREVAVYGDVARRRLVVKPGLTGLWQINGRSDLDWDESVRLDLRYVENWSFTFDFMIMWKTLGAVLRSRGAY